MGVLYKLTSPSGKSYIGISSKPFEARWSAHMSRLRDGRAPGPLYAALRKYGPESFSKTVLAIESDWDVLCEMERKAIREHGTFTPNGYNATFGGEGVIGPRSDEAKKAIAEAQRRRYQRPDELRRLRECGAKGNAANVARAVSAKSDRDAEREARRAYRQSAEFKAKHSQKTREAMARPDVRRKMEAGLRARSEDEAWRRRIREMNVGRKHGPASEARKRLIAEKQRSAWADPERRARRLLGMAAARAARAETKAAEETA